MRTWSKATQIRLGREGGPSVRNTFGVILFSPHSLWQCYSFHAWEVDNSAEWLLPSLQMKEDATTGEVDNRMASSVRLMVHTRSANVLGLTKGRGIQIQGLQSCATLCIQMPPLTDLYLVSGPELST